MAEDAGWSHNLGGSLALCAMLYAFLVSVVGILSSQDNTGHSDNDSDAKQGKGWH